MDYVYEDNGVYRVCPFGKVKIIFDPDDGVTSLFECSTCQEVLSIYDDREIFFCPECGFEMDMSEARSVCDVYIHIIGDMAPKLKTKKIGWLKWLWAKLFGGRKKSTVSLKP